MLETFYLTQDNIYVRLKSRVAIRCFLLDF